MILVIANKIDLMINIFFIDSDRNSFYINGHETFLNIIFKSQTKLRLEKHSFKNIMLNNKKNQRC